MLGRVLLIGDIHAETSRLARVLDHAAASHPDAILSVGDIVDGAEDPVACIALLRDAGALAVRGNHERWLLAGRPIEPFDGPPWALDWLAGLPATRTLDTPAGPLLLCHGVGEDDMIRLQPDATGYALESNDALQRLLRAGAHRWMVGGHTHHRMVRRFAGLTVLNPGTLHRRYDPTALEVDLAAGTGRWLRVEPDRIEPIGDVVVLP